MPFPSAALLVWTAAAAPGAPAAPLVFTHLEISHADSLDAAWAYDTVSHNVIFNCYDYLLGPPGPGGAPGEPRLSTLVPSRENGLISADGLEYAFPIRAGVLFPDGAELSPEDVRYSFLRFMLTDRAGGPSALLLKPLLGRDSTREASGRLLPGLYREAARSVRVEGRRVVFRLKRPFAPFLGMLHQWTAVLSRRWCAAHGEWDGREETLPRHNDPRRESSALMDKTFGTGPFRVESWDRARQVLRLARNDRYWRGPARLARVVIRVVPDFSVRRMMLAAGDADSIASTPQYASQLEGMPGVRVAARQDTLSTESILFFNMAIRPDGNRWIGSGRLDGAGIPPDFFSDKDVRLGFAAALDVETYAREALRGEGAAASSAIPDALLPQASPAPARGFSLAAAERHLRRALGGRLWEAGFMLTAAQLPAQEGGPVLLGMLRKSLADLNPRFRLEARALAWSSLSEQVESRKLPLVLFGAAAEYPDPHPIAYGLLHSSGYYPRAFGYSNAEADRLIEEAAGRGDRADRDALYRRLRAIEREDVPYVPVAQASGVRVERTWVRGWRNNPFIPRLPIGADYYPIYKE